MPKASVKRLINCKKEQLIDLVLDIEKYPEFVPFCEDAKVYEKKEYSPLTFSFLEQHLGKIMTDPQQVNYVIQYLKEQREIKTSNDLKRSYKNSN